MQYRVKNDFHSNNKSLPVTIPWAMKARCWIALWEYCIVGYHSSIIQECTTARMSMWILTVANCIEDISLSPLKMPLSTSALPASTASFLWAAKPRPSAWHNVHVCVRVCVWMLYVSDGGYQYSSVCLGIHIVYDVSVLPRPFQHSGPHAFHSLFLWCGNQNEWCGHKLRPNHAHPLGLHSILGRTLDLPLLSTKMTSFGWLAVVCGCSAGWNSLVVPCNSSGSTSTTSSSDTKNWGSGIRIVIMWIHQNGPLNKFTVF